MLYTFIADNGGTFISQVEAPSVGEAVRRWAEVVDLDHVGAEARTDLADSMTDEEPVDVDGLVGVWCFCVSLPECFTTVHVVGPE